MRRFVRGTAVAAAAGALVLTGGVLVFGLLPGIVSAQTPAPTPPTEQEQTPPGMRRHGHTEFINRLAQALGKTPDEVTQALQQVHEAHRGQRPSGGQGGLAAAALAPAAQQLGVTPQQLADAMRAAFQARAGNRGPGGAGQSGQGGPRMGQRPDLSAMFDAIAQQLGGGITGQQVQDALRSLRLMDGQRPAREQIQQRMEEHLRELAAALNVSVDELRTALQSIAPQGGRGPFGPRGR
jgi:hypothetical protein